VCLCVCSRSGRETSKNQNREAPGAPVCCERGFPPFPPPRLGEVYSGAKFAFGRRWPHAPHVALSSSRHRAGPEPGLAGAGAAGLSKLKQPLLIH